MMACWLNLGQMIKMNAKKFPNHIAIKDKNISLTYPELNKRVNRQVNSRSTTLFDTVGIYLGFTEKLVKMERLGITVTDDGYTRIDKNAKVINCAMEWKDLGAFEDLLVDRLIK